MEGVQLDLCYPVCLQMHGGYADSQALDQTTKLCMEHPYYYYFFVSVLDIETKEPTRYKNI
jgi:hypothetical protein